MFSRFFYVIMWAKEVFDLKENIYDNPTFFEQYSKMNRSVEGLKGAGEWHEFQKMMPEFHGKRVLDLGCGFGWHCLYAVENGAASAVGIDISEKMLTEARKKTDSPKINYVQQALEDIDFEADSFDVVLSSLALHYVASFETICAKVNQCLVSGGAFVFSVEHLFLQRKARRTGIMMETGTSCIGLWTSISQKVCGRRIFLGKM